jgi:hypothetical protein
MRGHRYFGRVHGIQFKPFTGTRSGMMMSGMAKAETRFYKTDYFKTSATRRMKIPIKT